MYIIYIAAFICVEEENNVLYNDKTEQITWGFYSKHQTPRVHYLGKRGFTKLTFVTLTRLTFLYLVVFLPISIFSQIFLQTQTHTRRHTHHLCVDSIWSLSLPCHCLVDFN